MTLADDAFADGFAARSDVHGKTWTFGSVQFVAIASPLRHDDVRLQGSVDRVLELETRHEFTQLPARGDELTCGGKYFRITSAPIRQTTGELTFLISPAALA